jgi:hypothetical protein
MKTLRLNQINHVRNYEIPGSRPLYGLQEYDGGAEWKFWNVYMNSQKSWSRSLRRNGPSHCRKSLSVHTVKEKVETNNIYFRLNYDHHGNGSCEKPWKHWTISWFRPEVASLIKWRIALWASSFHLFFIWPELCYKKRNTERRRDGYEPRACVLAFACVCVGGGERLRSWALYFLCLLLSGEPG